MPQEESRTPAVNVGRPEIAGEQRGRRVQSVPLSRVAVRRGLGNAFTWVLYAVIAIVFLLPLLWVLGNSFRSTASIWGNVFPVSWKTFVPFDGVSLRNYADALGLSVVAQGLGLNLGQALLISFASAASVVSLSLITNTGAAYFFGRLRFPGKRWLLLYVIVTMMIPQQVVIVPLFLVVHALGLINTFGALVVPWFASPFITFALTQFFAEVPRELDEAATMDGANLLQILIHVIIPNSLAGLLTVSLLEFQFIWNEFYWPLVAISSQNLMPVQVAIASQFTDRDPEWGRVFAAMVLASAPVILLFMFLQRFYYQSAVTSGIKG